MASAKDELKKLGIGKKIGVLREEKGLSLKKLSEMAGVQEILLSQIEADVVPPTVATLLNLSRLLGVTLDYFFTESLSTEKIEVVRKHERRVITKPEHKPEIPLSYSYESLAYHLAKKHMEPFLVEFELESDHDPVPLAHPGEEFLFLLEGEVEFISEDKKIHLHKGDSLYFFSQQPHSFRALGMKKPRAIVVVYPFDE